MATTQATIARLKVDIEKHLVRAPISGRIGDVVPLHAGAYVAEGQRLATIVPNGDLIIVADFSPSLTLGRVQRGPERAGCVSTDFHGRNSAASRQR